MIGSCQSCMHVVTQIQPALSSSTDHDSRIAIHEACIRARGASFRESTLQRLIALGIFGSYASEHCNAQALSKQIERGKEEVRKRKEVIISSMYVGSSRRQECARQNSDGNAARGVMGMLLVACAQHDRHRVDAARTRRVHDLA